MSQPTGDELKREFLRQSFADLDLLRRLTKRLKARLLFRLGLLLVDLSENHSLAPRRSSRLRFLDGQTGLRLELDLKPNLPLSAALLQELRRLGERPQGESIPTLALFRLAKELGPIRGGPLIHLILKEHSGARLRYFRLATRATAHLNRL